MKLRTEMLDPAQMTHAERADLCDRITQVTQQIFDGVTPERIRTHVIEVPADRTKIRLYSASNGRLMGYSIFHQYRRNIAGRPGYILRAEAGLLPEARGHHVVGHVLRTAFALRLRHPRSPMYYLDTLVHASSYHLFERYTPVIYPAPGRDMPPQLEQLVLSVLKSFPDPAIDPADPMVRKVGWITRENIQGAEKKNAPRKDSPGARFFKARNPGYVRGEGLIVVIPVTLANILGGALRVLGDRVTSRFRSSPDL